MKPLVSILIPAYNAEQWIAESIQSALAQTWPHREIIVVDDGSKDATVEVASRFEPAVHVVATANKGAAAARNEAFRLSRGEYIQWLDADDLLAPCKIENQLRAIQDDRDKQILLSSPWAAFFYRTKNCEFIQNSLCADLSPAEWLARKMGENLHMQTATWLTSRELAEAAGPWDEGLSFDDDGEYFCRVLIASNGTRFVPGAGVYYRVMPRSRMTYIGNSDNKKEALLRSIKLHIQYLRSLDDSERTRAASVTYIHSWLEFFYPERPDLVAQLRNLTAELGGEFVEPRLRPKYAWVQPLFGWGLAKAAQQSFPELKCSCLRQIDRLIHNFEIRHANAGTQAA